MSRIHAVTSSTAIWELAGKHHPFGLLTLNSFVLGNLLPMTLGNIVGGGLFVGPWQPRPQPLSEPCLWDCTKCFPAPW